MNFLFSELDSWIMVSALFLLMLVGWWLGFRWGRSLPPDERDHFERTFSDASMALLGLILAFTFSMSLTKHDQRRQMVVNDSNAIGEFYTCASLLKGPIGDQLRDVIRDYARSRLQLAENTADFQSLEQMLGKFVDQQAQMKNLVREAIDTGTPIAEPLVETLNNLTSNHASRLAAVRDRLPAPIMLLVFVAAIVTMSLVGTHQGALSHPRPLATLGFAVVVCLLIWVTLELNHATKGSLGVSQEPVRRVVMGMS